MALWKTHFSALTILASGFFTASASFAESTAPKANDVTFETRAENPSVTTTTVEDSDAKKDCIGSNFKEQNCLRQADAYQRAAQAAKYLAFYMMFEKVGPEVRENLKTSFDRCFVNPGNCQTGDQEKILSAAVQYNLGKELRHMILQNNTSMNNMRSLSGNANFLFSGNKGTKAGRAKELENPFRLSTQEVDDSPAYKLAQKELKQQEILGPQFMKDYGIFMNTYAKTSGQYQFVDASGSSVPVDDKKHWHFVSARVKSERAGGEIDIYKTPGTDQPKFKADQLTQDSKIVDEKLKEVTDNTLLQGSALDGKKSEVAQQLNAIMMNPSEMKDSKTGKPVEQKDIHRTMVADLNLKYDEAIEKKRKEDAGRGLASGATGTQRAVPLDVDFSVNQFSQFLDEIWPPSAAKPAGAPTKN